MDFMKQKEVPKCTSFTIDSVNFNTNTPMLPHRNIQNYHLH